MPSTYIYTYIYFFFPSSNLSLVKYVSDHLPLILLKLSPQGQHPILKVLEKTVNDEMLHNFVIFYVLKIKFNFLFCLVILKWIWNNTETVFMYVFFISSFICRFCIHLRMILTKLDKWLNTSFKIKLFEIESNDFILKDFYTNL